MRAKGHDFDGRVEQRSIPTVMLRIQMLQYAKMYER